MTKAITIAVVLAALAGCATEAGLERGAGFDGFPQFELDRAQREAALSGPRNSIVPPPRVTGLSGPLNVVDAPRQASPAAVAPQAIPSSALAEAGIGRTGGLDATPANTAPLAVNNPGISDEQSFDAVATRETIESDAERRAAQAAAREQIAPTAIPERPSTTGPNIVAYAIGAPNVKGQEWYRRSLLATQGRYIRNCAKYANADAAQRDFLARGGPERDRLGIDPDGDGFACGWDPAPFKQAAGN